MSQNIIVDEPTENQDDALSADAEHQTEEQEAIPAQPDAKDLPERYRGKSIEDIIEMHQNAEKKIGQQGNELGTYRELLQTMAEVKRVDDLSQEGTTETPVEVTTDSLLDNPQETISKLLEAELNKRLAPIEQQTSASRLQSEIQQLLAEHPDAEQIGEDPQFMEFVQSSPYRVQDAQKWAEAKDVDAARRLLTDFKELRGRTGAADSTGEKASSDVEAAKAVATESGRNSSGDNRQRKTLSRRDVMRVINTDRERYDSPAFQKMLQEHIRNGTLVD